MKTFQTNLTELHKMDGLVKSLKKYYDTPVLVDNGYSDPIKNIRYPII